MTGALLDVRNLRVAFPGPRGPVNVVDDVSFHVAEGETLGLIGESGSGKTVTALALLGLLPRPGRVADGKVLFRGDDLVAKRERELRRLRGREIAMVFQDPRNALNPLFTVGDQVAEVLALHRGVSRRRTVAEAAELLSRVGLVPERVAAAYPHQLSGGMCQRVLLAMAVACRPALLIADEPTSSLDVPAQAQILNLLKDTRQRMGMAVVLITHDLGVAAQTCDRIMVMYAGRVVESAHVDDFFTMPLHPYSCTMLSAIPLPDPRAARRREQPALLGEPPDPAAPPPGCRFHPRCPAAQPVCRVYQPALREVAPGHAVACHRTAGGAPG